MLAEAPPEPELRYSTAMWHFAHGMALLGKGDADGSALDLDSLRVIRAATPADAQAGAHPATTLLGIAEGVLAGELASHRGDAAGAVTQLQQAVDLEATLHYDEPPPAYIQPRLLLGLELLRQGKAKAAEEAFKGDFRDHRENGWALHGLAAALRAEKRTAEAKAVEARFRRAWRGADYQITESGD
jgi:hypothetical protein